MHSLLPPREARHFDFWRYPLQHFRAVARQIRRPREDSTSAANFRDFCHTTRIVRKYSGKAGDDFVAWVIEKFTDGPQDRGTFLNGLVTDLKNVRQLMDDRATQVKILKEQYERDSWELLDDDAKVMMEDTHSLRKV